MFSTSSLDDGDDDGGGGYHGGGGGGGFVCNDDNNSSNNGHDKIEAYYQKMIKANSGDPLLLGNYAKFLKEVIYYMIIWFISIHVGMFYYILMNWIKNGVHTL